MAERIVRSQLKERQKASAAGEATREIDWMLWGRRIDKLPVPPEQATYRVACLGFPLLTLGLVLGAWWGKLAWGDYWNWDPKELWSLTTFAAYLVYLHVRCMCGTRHPRLSSVLAKMHVDNVVELVRLIGQPDPR